jgi:hypothetical protein
MTPFILSQILIVIAICFDLISFQLKERDKILGCLLVSCTLIGMHFALLEQWTATGLALLAICRFSISMHTTSKKTMWLFIAMSVAVSTVTYDGWLSILTCCGSIFGTVGSFSQNDKQLRRFMFIGTSLWLLNNVVIGSPAAVIMEALFITSNIVGYYRFYMKPASLQLK